MARGVAGGVQDGEPTRAELDLLAARERHLDRDRRAGKIPEGRLLGVAVADAVLHLVSPIPVRDQPVRFGHERSIGETTACDRPRQRLFQPREPALVVEIRMGHHDEPHGLDRNADVAQGGEDRVARRRARSGVDEQRLVLARDQILEQVARADQRLDPPRPLRDLDDAHATSRVGSATSRRA